MYKHHLTITVATLFGAVAFTADQPTHVAPEMVRDVLAAGAVEVTDEAAADAIAAEIESVAQEKHVAVELDVLRATLADAIAKEDAAAPAEQPTA